MKRLLLLLLLLTSTGSIAQFSKTHYIPPLSNSDAQEPQGQFMYISSPSLTPVNFKIISLGGGTVNGTVTRDIPFVFNIGTGFNTQLLVNRANVNQVLAHKGFVVEAEDLVYVTVRLTTTPQSFQGGGLVSKGLAALGFEFRVGALLNKNVPATNENHYTFASVLATENNTIVTFSDIDAGVSLINNAAAGNAPAPVTLNRGESYVIAVQGPSFANRDGLVGMRISSSKPIAVNCGSIAGTNGDLNNLDLGFDQIVDIERVGTEYIFIKGNGVNAVERPLIVAHGPGPTDVFLHAQTITPFATLAAGEYLALDGSNYDANGNLYVKTSQKVFAYQGIGGSLDQANQNMCFVPPLNCETPKIIDNIPLINEIGNNTAFTGSVNVVTETGATLSFVINGTAFSVSSLPAGVTVQGPIPVTGNTAFETYKFQGLNGNISVYSTKQVYVSYFGSSGFATYGGFYSGFTFKPEISFNPIEVSGTTNCIPNIELKVNTLTAFDEFQWYFNDIPIGGANSSAYIPTDVPVGLGPGFYHVKAAIGACNTELISDKIPVSSCPTDGDGDGAIDNIDTDNNNDGLSNCSQSYGDIVINQSTATGSVQSPDGQFNVPFTTAAIPSGPQPAAAFTGNPDGSFISWTSSGIGNEIAQTVNFSSAVSIGMKYVMSAAATDLLSSNDNFILRVPVNKTITVLNPNDQLLIDTNYDGVFEGGITQYSSFEIRFRLNGGIALVPGTGTFVFLADQVTSVTYIHNNLSDDADSRATFLLYALCVPRDTDSDGIMDQWDIDADNDGIPNDIEARGANFTALPHIDANGNGMNDAFEPELSILDTDGDGVADYLDLDSDNDGIFDLIEAGHNGVDANTDGRIDFVAGSFGSNGLADVLETTPGSNTLNYSVAETDGVDGIQDYLDTDSDNDSCLDVTEANFSDGDYDGKLGSSPVTVDANGLVTSAADGNTVPVNNDYKTAAPITILTPPANRIVCDTQDTSFTIATGPATGYQWQVSVDGITYADLTDDSMYSGSGTATLTITGVNTSMDDNLYRVFISRTGNSCGLHSAPGLLSILPRPVVPATITLKQCDEDLDGMADFNLRQLEPLISANAGNETFTYYSTAVAAETADISGLIAEPTTYNNGLGSTVWVRIQNPDNCYDITEMQLLVTATQIPAGTSWAFARCDDFLDVNGNDTAENDDRDGITGFDFSSVTADIDDIMAGNPNYTISYYSNEADALAETDSTGNSLAITDISNFRNIESPGVHFIYVRVDSNIDNSCFGLGPYITLTTEALPTANSVSILRQCDRDVTDAVVDFAFDTAAIESAMLAGQTDVTVTYFAQDGSALPSPLPNPFITTTQTVRVRVTNNATQTADNTPCFDETELQFVVDAQPVAHPVTVPVECDDLPNDSDGMASFATTEIQAAILAGQTGFDVRYFAEDGSSLPSPLPDPFVTVSQVVTAVVENPANPDCSATETIIFTVNPLPEVAADITAAFPVIICTGIVNQKVPLSAGLLSGVESNYSFLWTFNGDIVSGANGSVCTVDEAGTYTVTITDRNTGCFRIRSIVAAYSSIAVITGVAIRDLVDNNTVTITPTGAGDYEYSLNEPEGPYSDNPVFEDVEPGFYTVFVRDKNKCGIASVEIAVLGAPQFFTPNGDSINDTWKITGINPVFHKLSNVFIFDRYGKLLREIPNGTDIGWDGTYNGAPLPADDYWYLLHVDDGRTATGHFTLKR